VSELGVVALVLGILLLATVVVVPIARRARGVRAGLEDELGGDLRRVANAQGLGLQSAGKTQVRGNGHLALTSDALVFRQWVPQRETRIPLAAVTAVGTERWWLGKSVGAKLLVVRWRTPAGGEDAMAWRVRDLDGWLAALDQA
jgi:hypothetical protein